LTIIGLRKFVNKQVYQLTKNLEPEINYVCNFPFRLKFEHYIMSYSILKIDNNCFFNRLYYIIMLFAVLQHYMGK